jgi:hypothetical protein
MERTNSRYKKFGVIMKRILLIMALLFSMSSPLMAWAGSSELTKEQALKIIAPSFDVKTGKIGKMHVEASDLKSWKYFSNAWVLYWIDQNDSQDESNSQVYQLHASVLEIKDDKIAVLARNDSINIEISELEESLCQSCTQPLDLAPYKISPTETAFGVRWYLAGKSGEQSRNVEYLCLFSIRDHSLDNILKIKTKEDEIISRDRGEGTEIKRIVIMSKQLTNGHYDILVRKVGEKKNESVYKWDLKNHSYEEQ